MCIVFQNVLIWVNSLRAVRSACFVFLVRKIIVSIQFSRRLRGASLVMGVFLKRLRQRLLLVFGLYNCVQRLVP